MASAVAMKIEGKTLLDLGLPPALGRIRELGFGFALGVVLFAGLAIVRGATVAATWSFGGGLRGLLGAEDNEESLIKCLCQK